MGTSKSIFNIVLLQVLSSMGWVYCGPHPLRSPTGLFILRGQHCSLIRVAVARWDVVCGNPCGQKCVELSTRPLQSLHVNDPCAGAGVAVKRSAGTHWLGDFVCMVG